MQNYLELGLELRQAKQALAQKEAALAQYKQLAKCLSDALLKVRPLGGSELFTRQYIEGEEEFFADADYCGKAIEKLRNDLQEARAALYTELARASGRALRHW